MEAFYVSIIFLGVILVIGSLFFIAMDKANGKDFFQEFDRKKEEMFNLIQDSEEMVQELNRISDYVVTVISEKNQEFFNKINSYEPDDNSGGNGVFPANQATAQEKVVPSFPVINIPAAVQPVSAVPDASDSIKEEAPEAAPDVLANAQTPNLNGSNNETESRKSGHVIDGRRKEVLKMIEQGMSDNEIADKLRIGRGEIGLIRVLYK